MPKSTKYVNIKENILKEIEKKSLQSVINYHLSGKYPLDFSVARQPFYVPTKR